ncbi:MAG TPA: rubrerythrin family protein [Bacteroidota bacterium]|nr:rubrerythrin family protein [Bacteroidota bacterium]
MKINRSFLRRIRTSLFSSTLTVLTLTAAFPLLLTDCKKNDAKGQKPEITIQNLQTAYSRESRISREYALFAKNAEKSRYSAIANLYKAAARAEQIHAEMAATLLRSKGIPVSPYVADSITVGTVMQTLRLALSDESLETESMYPSLARTADAEKFPEAAESFRRALLADKQHGALFKYAADRSGYIDRIQYYVCPCCGYIITSDTTKECPDCHEKREKFEKI